MSNAGIIAQQPAAQPAPQLTRADVYKWLPAMRRAANYDPKELAALDRAARILESLPWYMADEQTMIIKSETDPTQQYRITVAAGCNCPAGRPCSRPSKKPRQPCAGCLAGTTCHSARSCKHRRAFDMVRIAIGMINQAKEAAERQQQHIQRTQNPTQTPEDYQKTLESVDELF